MDRWDIFALFGNALFFSRFLVQWIASEKAGKPVAPRVFWWLSAIAAVIYSLYAWHEGEWVLLYGFLTTFLIYVRNLFLTSGSGSTLGPVPALIVSAAVVGLLFTGQRDKIEALQHPLLWQLVAMVGTTVWASRFVLQWWLSERRGVSHFPVAFWVVSLLGNALLLPYSIYIEKIPMIIGFSFSPVVQVRNLVLAFRAARTSTSGTAVERS